jgi:hypothetical protein
MGLFVAKIKTITAAGLLLLSFSSHAQLNLLASSAAITSELAVGVRKLELICQQPSSTDKSTSAPWHQAEPKLKEFDQRLQAQESQLLLTLQQAIQQQRCSQNSTSNSCQALLKHQTKVGTVLEQEKKLLRDSRDRLALYKRYETLESIACVRAGFTQRLWKVEMSRLWPVLDSSSERLSPLLELPKP